MSGRTDQGADTTPSCTRRAVLAGSATVLGGAAGFAVPTAGQITFPAVIPRPERWADENLAGFIIHVGGQTDPAELSAARNCSFEGWPPDETLAYDATLINRKQGDTPEEDTILYTGRDADVPGGALFLVNTFERCESDYVGVNLERIGRFDVGEAGGDRATDVGPVADVEADERPNEQTDDGAVGALGPGFGGLATLAGLLGGGVLWRWRRGD